MGLFKRYLCTKCKQITMHDILYEGQPVVRGEEHCIHRGEVSWGETCELCKCKGCENHVLVKTFWHSECDPDQYTIKYYPPVEKFHKENWHENLPEGLRDLSREVIQALNNQSYILAVMGCRSLIDLYANEVFKVDHGTFVKKIDELEKNGYISKKDKNIIQNAIDIGNETVHQGFKPNQSVADHTYEITCHLLKSFYMSEVDRALSSQKPQIKKYPRKKLSSKSNNASKQP